jgi:hypothetical protein
MRVRSTRGGLHVGREQSSEKTGVLTPRGTLHLHATLGENDDILPTMWLKQGEHSYDGSQARQRVPYLC